jgi:ankyrin repeat protein
MTDSYGQLVLDMWRDPSALQRHLDAGHSIDPPSSQGEPLLYVACARVVETLSKGSDTLVKQLMQAGANPNASTRDGFTALMQTSSSDVAHYLLDNGADIEREAKVA